MRTRSRECQDSYIPKKHAGREIATVSARTHLGLGKYLGLLTEELIRLPARAARIWVFVEGSIFTALSLFLHTWLAGWRRQKGCRLDVLSSLWQCRGHETEVPPHTDLAQCEQTRPSRLSGHFPLKPTDRHLKNYSLNPCPR